MRVVVSGIGEWLRRNVSLLKRLNVMHDNIDELSLILGEEEVEMVIEENPEEDSSELPSEAELDHLMESANTFSVDFSTLK